MSGIAYVMSGLASDPSCIEVSGKTRSSAKFGGGDAFDEVTANVSHHSL